MDEAKVSEGGEAAGEGADIRRGTLPGGLGLSSDQAVHVREWQRQPFRFWRLVGGPLDGRRYDCAPAREAVIPMIDIEGKYGDLVYTATGMRGEDITAEYEGWRPYGW